MSERPHPCEVLGMILGEEGPAVETLKDDFLRDLLLTGAILIFPGNVSTFVQRSLVQASKTAMHSQQDPPLMLCNVRKAELPDP